MIKNGKQVELEYTVYLEDGLPVDTNVGEQPLIFVMGKHEVFPALEKEIEQLSVGDKKKIELSAEQAYGPVLQDAFREIALSMLPEKYRQQGALLGIQDPSGGLYPVRVHAIKGETCVLDFNHPLAGKSLRFDVKVLKVK
jgi:FKBP-type peptidyl-prolyl cis-trans isomerase 2